MVSRRLATERAHTPGNTITKALSRLWVYRRASELFQAGGRPGGWAVVLAGREAAEVVPLRDLLEWDPSKVLFVDRLAPGLKRMKRAWPNAYTFHGDLIEALPHLTEGLGFVNLDFMGFFRPEVRRILEEVGKLLLPRGFVSYTFSRGRENKHSKKYWKHLGKEAEQYLEENPDVRPLITGLDQVRFLGYGIMMEKALNKPPIHLASTILYRAKPNNGVSMGVISLQHMPEQMQNERWLDLIESDRFCGRATYKMACQDEDLQQTYS